MPMANPLSPQKSGMTLLHAEKKNSSRMYYTLTSKKKSMYASFTYLPSTRVLC